MKEYRVELRRKRIVYETAWVDVDAPDDEQAKQIALLKGQDPVEVWLWREVDYYDQADHGRIFVGEVREE